MQPQSSELQLFSVGLDKDKNSSVFNKVIAFFKKAANNILLGNHDFENSSTDSFFNEISKKTDFREGDKGLLELILKKSKNQKSKILIKSFLEEILNKNSEKEDLENLNKPLINIIQKSKNNIVIFIEIDGIIYFSNFNI